MRSNVRQRWMSRHDSLNQPLTFHRCSVFWGRHWFAHNTVPAHRSSAVYWLLEAQTAPVCCADGPGDWNSIGFLWKIICGRRLVYQGEQMEPAAAGLARFHRIDQALKKKKERVRVGVGQWAVGRACGWFASAEGSFMSGDQRYGWTQLRSTNTPEQTCSNQLQIKELRRNSAEHYFY